MKITILGCGSSGGVPRIGGHWGACDPTNPKNRRRRCAVLVEKESHTGTTMALIDTPPDIREQLLDAGTTWLDGVFYTHDHADHTHGIDDLRVIAMHNRKRVPVHMSDATYKTLKLRFSYCFETPPGGEYPPILDRYELPDYQPVTVSGKGGNINVLPFTQLHGAITSMGFRIGNFAYSTDVHDFPKSSQKYLEGLDVWVIDALRYTPHPSHLRVEETLEWIGRMKPKRAIITNMHVDLDYETLKAELPEGVEPAYDGMEVFLE